MVKLSDFIPSADLLEKLEGLEEGLKQRRRPAMEEVVKLKREV